MWLRRRKDLPWEIQDENLCQSGDGRDLDDPTGGRNILKNLLSGLQTDTTVVLPPLAFSAHPQRALPWGRGLRESEFLAHLGDSCLMNQWKRARTTDSPWLHNVGQKASSHLASVSQMINQLLSSQRSKWNVFLSLLMCPGTIGLI